ncbi:DNA primase [Bacillus andreraoultii]|uniref:DNA primase n=1 Tax=Bacillus andreraoultii TaxID=1499685 RepID=UPI00053A65CB|nr:DNA primase [Bacillus andreraoultii]
MGERIPKEIINEISQSVDIVDVISEYVHLKKQGRNYFGLCPFHDEKSPSFSVSVDKQIFYCFGCHAGGNVFSFLMDLEGISFQDAAIKLAERANIPLHIEKLKTNNVDGPKTDHEKMIEAHELLRQFYHHLLVNTNKGQEALEYLTKRDFTREMIDHFQIGYCLNDWDTSLKFLKSRGFHEELLEQAGLIIRSEANNRYFDRFRGRIIFPIYDNKGNTIAFSGRVIHEGEPKYLNSPETPIFHKGKVLYNFHKARPAIRKKQEVIIFEGFADCISAFGAGVDNGIGTMGTALTEEHIHLIKRNTDRVILCFDADKAGQNATFKAGELLQEAGCLVQVAVIPDAKDPDEYIRVHGNAFVNKVIGTSLTFMAFKMKYYRQGKNLQNEGDRLIYIEQVLKDIAAMENAIERDVYLRQIAEEFSISLDALKQQQRKLYYAHRKKTNNQPQLKHTPVIIQTEKKLREAFENAERMLIAQMLKSISFANRVQKALQNYTFNLDEHQAIVTYLYAYYEEGNEPDLTQFLSFVKDKYLRDLIAEIGMIPTNDDISDKEFTDYIKHVIKQHKLLKIKEKEKASKEAELEKNYKKAAELVNEIILLKKSL